MKPIPEFHALRDDLFVWHGYSPDCRTDCSSTAVGTPEGVVLVDPIRLEEQALERMVGDRRVAAILLTSGNHWRAASYEKERLDVPVFAPEGARDAVQADHWVRDGEILFGHLKAIALPGGGPGETAYLAPEALILGDAIVHLDGLAILPDKYCTNPRLLRESLKVLPSLEFSIVCFAHGLPVIENRGRTAIHALVG